jgi:DNA-binding NtrC family response regulator
LISMNMAEAKSLEDRIEAIGHLAREGGAWARRGGGLSAKTALEAIAALAASSLTEATELRGRALANVESLPAEGVNLEAYMGAVRKRLMQEALDRCDGGQTKAAKLLQMSFRSFRYYRRKYGLGSDEKKPEQAGP